MENSIAKMSPALIKEWSPMNAPVTPEEVPYGSNKLYWWLGACGHEWQASAKARSVGEGCPICANARIIPGINDLESQYPDLAKEWSPKNRKQPSDVGPGSHKKAIWIGKCGHEWEAPIRNRVKGAGCPYCSHNAVLPGFNDLETLYPEVAKEWSPRNFPLLPSQVTAFSNKRRWWRCEHGHEWYTHVSTRSYGSKCPYCTGIRLLKGFNDLATRHPHLAKEWSNKNGDLLPDMVNEKSRKNVWWRCSVCGNEYKAVIHARVKGLQCPVCAERAVLPGYNDLATTDPELALEWDVERNGGKLPSQISRNSQYSVWWTAACGHLWKDKVFNRAVLHAGCIYCEKEFLWHLPQLLVMQYAKKYGFMVCLDDENTIGIPLDAYIPELKLAFAFPHKGTEAEQGIQMVTEHLCRKRGIICEHIGIKKQPEEICIEIKQGFAKTHTFIQSDNAHDIAVARKRLFEILRNTPRVADAESERA